MRLPLRRAQNLKDSGIDVVVGLRPESSSAEKARSDGFEVLDISEAASRGDIVMVLLPDQIHRQTFEESIRGAMTLKSVSRSRSDVGLTFIDGGLLRFLPLYSPAIIRISVILFHAKTQR